MLRRLSLAGLLLAVLGAAGCKEKSGEKIALRARILPPAGVTAPYEGLDAVRISVVQGATLLGTREFGVDDVWTIPEVEADLASPIAIRVDGLAGGVIVKSGRTAPFMPREARPDGQGIYFAPVNAWAPAADVPDSPRMRAGVAALGDGRVVMVGGVTSTANGIVLATLEVYDPEEGEWRVGATLQTAREHPLVVELVDGRLLVAGGTGADGALLASTELVTLPPRGDPTALAVVAPAADLPHPWTTMLAARLPSGKILVGGGSAVTGGAPAVFDPAAGTWTVFPEGVPARGAVLVPLDGGRVAIVGGGDAATFRRVDLVGEETGSPVLRPGPDVLRVARFGASAIAIDPSRILVTGGAENLARTQPTAATEIVDVASDGSITSTFAERDDDHLSIRSSTAVRDGRILLAGGTGPDPANASTSAILFDIATARYVDAGDLPVPMAGRRSHAPLPDGTMLFAGCDRRTETLVFNPPVVAPAERERVDYTITLATTTRATGGVLDGAATMRVRAYDLFSQVDERTFPAASSAYTFGDFAVSDDGLRFLVEAVDAAGTAVAWGATVEQVTPDALRSGTRNVLLARAGEFNLAPSVLPSPHGDGGAALLGGTIAIAGGLGGEFATDLYDPTSGAISTLATSTLPTSRRVVRAAKAGGDRLLLAGGVSANAPTAAASVLTEANGTLTWSAASPVPTPLTQHAAIETASGEVVVTGGQISADSPTARPISFAARWNGSTWAPPAPGAPPVQTRGRHNAVVLGNGTILLAGGVTTSSGTFGPTIMATECETLDPVSLSPTPTNGCLATPRRDFVAFSTTNGGAVLCGGVPALAAPSIATCERYDVVTRTFSAAGSLSAARDDSTVATFGDGRRSVVVGGVGPAGLSSAVDLWDGAMSAMPSMRVGRAFPAVVPLPDGRLVVLGGINTAPNPDVPLNSVEVWTPAAWTNPFDTPL